jgi:hypothetical protein
MKVLNGLFIKITLLFPKDFTALKYVIYGETKDLSINKLIRITIIKVIII